jgi:hypothetical protein
MGNMRDVHTWQSAEGSYWASQGRPARRPLPRLARRAHRLRARGDRGRSCRLPAQPAADRDAGRARRGPPGRRRRRGPGRGIRRRQLGPRERAQPPDFPTGGALALGVRSQKSSGRTRPPHDHLPAAVSCLPAPAGCAAHRSARLCRGGPGGCSGWYGGPPHGPACLRSAYYQRRSALSHLSGGPGRVSGPGEFLCTGR